MVTARRVVDEGNTLLGIAENRTIPYKDGGMTLDGMDCQGLCEYLLIQCGMQKRDVNMAGTNEHIRRSARWFGTIEECVALFGYVPAGAWIYIWTPGYNQKYDDNLGNASHMGQMLDNGRVLHASASRGRVLLSDNRVTTKSIPNGGWNAVLLPKYILFPDDIEQKLGNTIEEGETMSLNGKTCIVTGGDLKLRPAKSTKGVWLAMMSEGAEVQVESDDGTWAGVMYTDAKGKVTNGYAMRQYLTEKAGEASTEQAANAETGVVVTGSGVWIQTPTPEYAVALANALKTAEAKN